MHKYKWMMSAVVFCLVIMGLSAALGSEAGPLLHLSFDGKITADSAKGKAEGYQKKPAHSVTYIQGVKGQAVLLNNGSIYYEARNNFRAPAGTVMFWAKPVDWDPAQPSKKWTYFFSAHQRIGRGGKDMIAFWRYPATMTGGLYQYFSKQGSNLGNYVFEIKDWEKNQWNFFAFTWDKKGTAKIFIDGKLFSTKTREPKTLPVDINELSIGGSGTAYDEFRVFDRPLAEEEIQAWISEAGQKVLKTRAAAAKASGVGSYYTLFEDDFNDLPTGKMTSDKWDIATRTGDKTEIILEVTEEKERGQVVHIRAANGGVFLSPKPTFGEIPYILEYDLKLAPPEIIRDINNLGRIRIIFHEPGQALDLAPYMYHSGWQISQNDVSHTYYIPELSKSTYTPFQIDHDWVRVRVDVDGDKLVYAVKQKNRTTWSTKPWPLTHWQDRPGRLLFRVCPSWPGKAWECWLDNVVIKLKPVTARQSYKRRAITCRELQASFADSSYRAAAGDFIPPQLEQAGKLLEEISALSTNEAEGYKNGLAELDRLLEQCVLAYRKHEPAVFSAVFTRHSEYKPLDLSGFYNDAPSRRPAIFSRFTPLVEVQSIPFWVSPVAPYALGFSLTEKSSVEIPVGAPANEIFLLIQPYWEVSHWQPGGVYPDGPVGSNLGPRGPSEAFQVAFQAGIRYADGEEEKAFPLLFPELSPEMKRNRIAVYSVRPSRNKPIASITLRDKMNDFGAIVYGVTLGTKSAEPSVTTQPAQSAPPKIIVKGAATVSIKEDTVILESPAYRIAAARSGTLRLTELFNKYGDEDFLSGSSGDILLTGPFLPAAGYSQLIEDKTGILVPAKPENPHFATWQIQKVQKKSADEVIFQIENSGKNLSGSLQMQADFDQVRMKVILKNTGSNPQELTVVFPLLKNIKAQGYFAPKGMGVVSEQPLDYFGAYGCDRHALMQLMAVWDSNERSGISVRTEDITAVEMKAYRLYKPTPAGRPGTKIWGAGGNTKKYLAEQIGPMGNGMVLGVQYFYLSLQPGESRELPPAVIGVHPGTWKEPLQRYIEWVRSWWSPLRPTPERLRRVALSVTGGNLDVPTHKTGLEWGGVDVVHFMDIHSVDYPAEIEKKIPEIRRSRDNFASRRPPVGRGIYTADGSYFKTNAKLFHDIGYAWALKDEKGNLDWFMPYTKEQLRVCRSLPQWHEALAKQFALVAREVDPVWVYIDTVGASTPDMCFNKEHNHSSPAEELRGLSRLAGAVTTAVMDANPEVAVISEGPGSDYYAQFQDGSWFGQYPSFSNPGHFLFFRYVVPTFKLINLSGDSVTKSKISYFNGVPVNIYIYGGEDRVQATLRPLVKAYREFYDIFTGKEMEVDVPTGAQGVYMNRFGSRQQNKIVYAVANWGYQTWQGSLELDYFPNAQYVEVTRDNKKMKFTVVAGRHKARVEFSIDPYEVAYIAVLKEKPGGTGKARAGLPITP